MIKSEFYLFPRFTLTNILLKNDFEYYQKKPKPNPNVKVTLSAANVLYFTFISSWKKSWNYRWWALAKGYARQKLLQERPYVPVEIWVLSTSCRKYSKLYRFWQRCLVLCANTISIQITAMLTRLNCLKWICGLR